MTPDRVRGSFRDPSGFLFRHDDIVYRAVSPLFRDSYDRFMSSGFYQTAVDRGLLVAHEEIDPASVPVETETHRVLRPEQLPFVSYPYEWCFSQLKDAALLTLDLHTLAIEHDLWLKDASAYNVQFLRGKPVFIDSLSFELYPEGQPWIAYQQFCRHFLAPLALMARCHVDLGKLMRENIDGIPLELASRLLPTRSRLSFGLGLHLHAHARSLQTHGHRTSSAARAKAGRMSRNALLGLATSLRGLISRLAWSPAGTEWGNYYEDTNYSDAAFETKRDLIASWIDETEPRSVWDLGANTGVFSRVSSDKGIHTVAADVDPAAVEKNYRRVRENDEAHLLPLLLDLTNPSPDLGWDFDERMSLRSRGPADLVMALALIHHLAISNNVPLPRIAEFFRGLGRSLIIEFVPKSDSQVQRLLQTRDDIFPDYHEAGFLEAFEPCFSVQKHEAVEGSERTLYLLERR
jgi:hypothetical protein